jgi:two-component system, chemotaxis family, response regulator Rcp1
MRYKPIHILLVEDNPADIDLMREALISNRIPFRLTIAQTAGDALDVAFRRGDYTSSPKPDIVMLDLKLGTESGHDVLRQLKTATETHCIPVIVLSSSGADPDVREAYGAFANCYITKPFQLDEFVEVVRQVENFWARVAVLPEF